MYVIFDSRISFSPAASSNISRPPVVGDVAKLKEEWARTIWLLNLLDGLLVISDQNR